MNAPSRPLPPTAPRPPHDPTFWHLDARAGWHAAASEHLDELPGALRLERARGSARALAESSGAFGGIVLPRWLAWVGGPGGTLYLLDRDARRLLAFDVCECRFEPVPCFGGAQAFVSPSAIAIRGATLFVCDPHAQRLARFSLHGFTPRSGWAPPPPAGLAYPWQPWAMAFDANGIAHVSDIANLLVHRFHPSGAWLGTVGGFARPRAIAFDRAGRLYVVDESPTPHVVRLRMDGAGRETLTRPEAIADAFAPLPVAVDASGNVDLGRLCVGDHPAACWFDAQGRRLEPAPDTAVRFATRGRFLSEPLDSGIERCQWHRIELQGSLPAGTRIRLRTYGAETAQLAAHVRSLPDSAWASGHVLATLDATGAWDGLVTSPPGRFLWLEIRLESNGEASPRIDALRIEYPRISLRRYLPDVFGEDARAAEFSDRFLALFDTTLRSIESRIDRQAALYDPMATPADPGAHDFLAWLATWLDVTLERQWPEHKRRALLARAAASYARRGTREGLRDELLFLLDMLPETRCCPDDAPLTVCDPRPVPCAPPREAPCFWQPPPLVLEHYRLRRWLFVGRGRLGDEARLWGARIVNRSQLGAGARADSSQLVSSADPPRDPFHVYAHRFSVFVPAALARKPPVERALRAAIDAHKPAHSDYQLVLVEPRFRIGVQSSIGFDTAVGRYPSGVTLDADHLGRATVLPPPAHALGRAPVRVGREARLGSNELN